MGREACGRHSTVRFSFFQVKMFVAAISIRAPRCRSPVALVVAPPSFPVADLPQRTADVSREKPNLAIYQREFCLGALSTQRFICSGGAALSGMAFAGSFLPHLPDQPYLRQPSWYGRPCLFSSTTLMLALLFYLELTVWAIFKFVQLYHLIS